MYFMLDNYDSFVYNLSAYLKELGQEILVKREGEITLSEIEALGPEGILLSPGPGKPSDAAMSLQILERWKEKIPILGVCLGHQAVGHYFGARVEKGARPMHGKQAQIIHKEGGLFSGIPQGFLATRYHSLIVSKACLPLELSVDAVSASDGVIMGLSHRHYPIYGVQFHPEAVLTECGLELLENFVKICKKWRKDHENHKNF
ncbi:MAG: aminodeoxychorismate/anthranilate synthase component II [Lachnospiraceae bacterium]|nr:aminodeoxychorismate/anthranilate synthase component II [Lachnospiraceae bacterium]